MPGSRGSALKRKVDGTVVRRDEHARCRGTIECVGSERASDEAEASAATPIVVDPVANLTERLCPRGMLSDNKSESEAVDQMANRTTSKAKLASASEGDAATSGDVLPAIPAHLDFLFSDRPLLPGEEPDQYETLLCSIVHQIRPADVIEAIWVKNITDLIWEANRIRGWRRQILVQAQLQAAGDLIRPALQNADPMGLNQFMTPSADSLAAGWMAGDAEPRA